jgi:hypothetical protein
MNIMNDPEERREGHYYYAGCVTFFVFFRQGGQRGALYGIWHHVFVFFSCCSFLLSGLRHLATLQIKWFNGIASFVFCVCACLCLLLLLLCLFLERERGKRKGRKTWAPLAFIPRYLPTYPLYRAVIPCYIMSCQETIALALVGGVLFCSIPLSGASDCFFIYSIKLPKKSYFSTPYPTL